MRRRISALKIGCPVVIGLFVLFIITGCSSPEPPLSPEVVDNITITSEPMITAPYEAMIGLLEGSIDRGQAEIDRLNNQAIELQYKILSLEIGEALLRAEVKALNEGGAEAAKTAIETSLAIYQADRENLETMNEELQKAQSRLAIINNHIGTVRKGNVPELSDNLTAEEYAAFYKGWDIWWRTFNEKGE